MSNRAAPWPGDGLVLAGPGGLPMPSPAANRLAGLLGLRSIEPPVAVADDPTALLTALAAEPPGWLLPLGLDPGQQLDGCGCWAEALAAWQQPVLLLLPGDGSLPSGCARAYSALLQQGGVACLGLVQVGGLSAPQPGRDGLTWLGWLDPAAADGETIQELALALRLRILLRWRTLSAARPDPPTLDRADATDPPA